uniref:Uncharacterized protein n=1 Tax=Trichobilharzia regenti TaxID=157069 RepID=A0AA85J5U2_TRIRE|nr:unnamed protein product [Trichobilharzia regenti]
MSISEEYSTLFSVSTNKLLGDIPLGYYIWILIDVVFMILTTTAVLVLFTKLQTISSFFRNHFYVTFFIVFVGAILLLPIVDMTNLPNFCVYFLLGSTVLLWSVSLAAGFGSVDMFYGFISLILTTVITILTVGLARKLPSMDDDQLTVFTTISINFLILSVVLIIFSVAMQPDKPIFKILSAFFFGLFVICLIFGFINKLEMVVWWFSPYPSQFVEAFILWLLMFCLFVIVYTTSLLPKIRKK